MPYSWARSIGMGVCLFVATASEAGVTRYTDSASFHAAASIESTETFDEFPHYANLGMHVVTADGITYTSGDPGSWWRAGNALMYPDGFVSSPNDLSTSEI